MEDNSKVTRQAGRFLIVGVIATLLHWGIYTLIKVLCHLREPDGWELTAAYSTGYAISLLVNYQLSLRYTFHTKGSFGKGVGFVLSHIVNCVLHVALLNLFLRIGAGQFMVRVLGAVSPGLIRDVPLLGDPAVLVPLPVFIIVIPVNFLLVRFSFLRTKDAPLLAQKWRATFPGQTHSPRGNTSIRKHDKKREWKQIATESSAHRTGMCTSSVSCNSGANSAHLTISGGGGVYQLPSYFQHYIIERLPSLRSAVERRATVHLWDTPLVCIGGVSCLFARIIISHLL